MKTDLKKIIENTLIAAIKATEIENIDIFEKTGAQIIFNITIDKLVDNINIDLNDL